MPWSLSAYASCYLQSLTLLVSPEITHHDHSVIACSSHIYVWCCFSRTSHSWWITQSTQHHRRGCNNIHISNRWKQLIARTLYKWMIGINNTNCAINLQLDQLVFTTLASGCFWGFSKKNTETHVALRGNFSRSVSATDLVEMSKDAASLVCTWKIFFGWGQDFLWVTS